MNNFYETIVETGNFSNRKRLKFKLDELFKSISFRDKAVLDIGGGIGLLGLFAVSNGAKSSINLEPEADGSSTNLDSRFKKLCAALGNEKSIMIGSTFQDYNSDEKFDLVIMYNSINHLNEEMCVSLDKSKTAREVYIDILKKLNKIINPDGLLLVSDCSNKNFWPSIGMKNPFAKSIEWKKHQSPKVWIPLFEKAGFTCIEKNWSSYNRLGKVGKFLFANKLAAYFFSSHFNLRFKKTNN